MSGQTKIDELTELEMLKQQADALDIKYSPNISEDTLRARINAHTTEPKEPVKPNKGFGDKRADALKLERIIVTNLNPNKKHSEGEYIRAGNRALPSICRFVPFGVETHAESILVRVLEDRVYCGVDYVKDADGNPKPSAVSRKEFQIERLPQLTPSELKKLAAEQSARSRL